MTTTMIVLTIANIALVYLWARVIREWRTLEARVRADNDRIGLMLEEIKRRSDDLGLTTLSQVDKVEWKH